MSHTSRIAAIAAVAWATASPLLWWHNISARYGAQIPWEFMLQLAALAAIGIVALPALWRGVRWGAWAVIGAVVAVVLSHVMFPSAMLGGLLMNGALLCIAAWLTLRSSGPAPAKLAGPLS